VAQNHPDPIDLLLTDVVMPAMNGPALAAKLARGRPHLKVLYISGYTGSYVAHRGLVEKDSPLLQQPFTSDALLRKLQEVMDSARDPAEAATIPKSA
jgi:YesN/AraC family two-component response regulator